MLAVAADREPREHVRRNRARWDVEARDYVGGRRARLGARGADVGHLARARVAARRPPADLRGKDAIELGCGTAYVSAWLARRGARVVGIDDSTAQLADRAPAAARARPRLPADPRRRRGTCPVATPCFDLAISEYGACLWADPDRWVPEAARILRPGGELIFLVNSTLLTLCVPAENDLPAGDRLLRPAFGMYRVEWPEDPGVEFHLSHGDWIRRLRANGFEIEDLIEVRPPETATTALRVRHTGVVATVAGRRDLAGAAPVKVGPWTTC